MPLTLAMASLRPDPVPEMLHAIAGPTPYQCCDAPFLPFPLPRDLTPLATSKEMPLATPSLLLSAKMPQVNLSTYVQ